MDDLFCTFSIYHVFNFIHFVKRYGATGEKQFHRYRKNKQKQENIV